MTKILRLPYLNDVGKNITYDSTLKTRWDIAQTKEQAFWKKPGVIDSEMERVISRYGAILNDIADSLKEDSTILDVGSGPTCAANLFRYGSKVYLDPLALSFHEHYGQKLPNGNWVCGVGENICFKSNTFDIILCINSLDHMADPVRALEEIKRVLKKQGILVLGIFVHHPIIAFFRKLIEIYLPFFMDKAHPHSFTLNSIQRLLSRFFYITQKIRVFQKSSILGLINLHREDWVFICTNSSH